MTRGPCDDCFRSLLLGAEPGSLAALEDVWLDAEVNIKRIEDTQGLADHISRDKIQLMICELRSADANGLKAIQQVSRVHPALSLSAVLPEPDLDLSLLTFRNGIDNILIGPVDQKRVTEDWRLAKPSCDR
jgi:DNA-binding NtrC family response regulator